MSTLKSLMFVFDRMPDQDGCTFVEVENESGESICAGEWRDRADGLVELVVPVNYDTPESQLAALREELAATKNGYKWESERAAMLLEALNNCEADLAQHSSFESLYTAAIDERDVIQQRLADAERQNAVMSQLLREGIEEFKEGDDWIERVVAALRDAAINPKPEATSHED